LARRSSLPARSGDRGSSLGDRQSAGDGSSTCLVIGRYRWEYWAPGGAPLRRLVCPALDYSVPPAPRLGYDRSPDVDEPRSKHDQVLAGGLRLGLPLSLDDHLQRHEFILTHILR